MGMNEATRYLKILKIILKCRLKDNQQEQMDCVGPNSTLDVATEAKLANHIKRIEISHR